MRLFPVIRSRNNFINALGLNFVLEVKTCETPGDKDFYVA